MKKSLLIIAMTTFFFSSCNNTKTEVSSSDPETHKTVENKEHEDLQSPNNDWIDDIQLNNGSKWTANEETNIGVEKMKNVLNVHETNALEDYHSLARELTTIKNYVVKECTMKGPSHDNLHVWLLPLLEKLDALIEAKTTKEAANIKQSIKENVVAYSDYFQ